VHVAYGEHEAMIEIESGRVRGAFPPRALGMALEWTCLRHHDLLEDWDLVRRHLVPKPIAPLDWMFAFDVLEARFVRDRVVWLRFRDGTSGEVDLTPELWGEGHGLLSTIPGRGKHARLAERRGSRGGVPSRASQDLDA